MSGIGFCMIGILLFSGVLLLRYSISPLVDAIGALDAVVGFALVAFGLWKVMKSREAV